MTYKFIRTDDFTGKKIYEKVSDDGKSYSSCSEDDEELKAWIAAGNTLGESTVSTPPLAL